MSLDSNFEQLFREHSRMLYRTAYTLLKNSADSEDVLQTIFLRLLRGGLPPELKQNAKGYLYRIAVNLSLDIIRARKRQELARDNYPVEIAGTADSDALEGKHQQLAEALATLDPETVQILVLKYAHSYTDAEIARVLGTSRGAIAMRLLRSRSRLKQLMHEFGEIQ
jgi:RNA polymerase sigma-70 factor (ECF subfamily)